MADTPTILITGASGNVGGEILKLFIEQHTRVAVTSTDPSRLTGIYGDQVEARKLDFADPATFGPALEGCDTIFLMRPPQISNAKKFIQPFINKAREMNVKQIVFLSLQGVQNNPVVPHHAIEKMVRESGVPYTFLRAGFFMQNLSTTHREEIRDRSEIFIPAGKGKTSFIDVRDIAAVAFKSLTETGHDNKAYELTGEAALEYGAVAAMLSQELGRPITYVDPSIFRFFTRMREQGAAAGFILVMIALYTVCKLGKAGALTTTTQELLGRAPISMRQFIADHRAVWL